MSNGIMRREERRGKHRNTRKPRPKTFKSEDAAHAYAKKYSITGYVLTNLRLDPRRTPKIRIDVQ